MSAKRAYNVGKEKKKKGVQKPLKWTPELVRSMAEEVVQHEVLCADCNIPGLSQSKLKRLRSIAWRAVFESLGLPYEPHAPSKFYTMYSAQLHRCATEAKKRGPLTHRSLFAVAPQWLIDVDKRLKRAEAVMKQALANTHAYYKAERRRRTVIRDVLSALRAGLEAGRGAGDALAHVAADKGYSGVTQLWSSIRLVSMERLRLLQAAGDRAAAAPSSAAMTAVDWLAVDTHLLYSDDSDALLTQDALREYGPLSTLVSLLSLVERYGLAAHDVTEEQWRAALTEYKHRGCVSSLPVLQRRWYELCQLSRRQLAGVCAAGGRGGEQGAGRRVTPLVRQLALRFPRLMTTVPLPWSELVADGRVFKPPLSEYLTAIDADMGVAREGWEEGAERGAGGGKKTHRHTESDDDITVIEQHVETIDLAVDSDAEEEQRLVIHEHTDRDHTDAQTDHDIDRMLRDELSDSDDDPAQTDSGIDRVGRKAEHMFKLLEDKINAQIKALDKLKKGTEAKVKVEDGAETSVSEDATCNKSVENEDKTTTEKTNDIPLDSSSSSCPYPKENPLNTSVKTEDERNPPTKPGVTPPIGEPPKYIKITDTIKPVNKKTYARKKIVSYTIKELAVEQSSTDSPGILGKNIESTIQDGAGAKESNTITLTDSDISNNPPAATIENNKDKTDNNTLPTELALLESFDPTNAQTEIIFSDDEDDMNDINQQKNVETEKCLENSIQNDITQIPTTATTLIDTQTESQNESTQNIEESTQLDVAKSADDTDIKPLTLKRKSDIVSPSDENTNDIKKSKVTEVTSDTKTEDDIKPAIIQPSTSANIKSRFTFEDNDTNTEGDTGVMSSYVKKSKPLLFEDPIENDENDVELETKLEIDDTFGSPTQTDDVTDAPPSRSDSDATDDVAFTVSNQPVRKYTRLSPAKTNNNPPSHDPLLLARCYRDVPMSAEHLLRFCSPLSVTVQRLSDTVMSTFQAPSPDPRARTARVEITRRLLGPLEPGKCDVRPCRDSSKYTLYTAGDEPYSVPLDWSKTLTTGREDVDLSSQTQRREEEQVVLTQEKLDQILKEFQKPAPRPGRPARPAAGPAFTAHCCAARRHLAYNAARARNAARRGRPPPPSQDLHDWHHAGSPCSCCCRAALLSSPSRARLAAAATQLKQVLRRTICGGDHGSEEAAFDALPPSPPAAPPARKRRPRPPRRPPSPADARLDDDYQEWLRQKNLHHKYFRLAGENNVQTKICANKYAKSPFRRTPIILGQSKKQAPTEPKAQTEFKLSGNQSPIIRTKPAYEFISTKERNPTPTPTIPTQNDPMPTQNTQNQTTTQTTYTVEVQPNTSSRTYVMTDPNCLMVELPKTEGSGMNGAPLKLTVTVAQNSNNQQSQPIAQIQPDTTNVKEAIDTTKQDPAKKYHESSIVVTKMPLPMKLSDIKVITLKQEIDPLEASESKDPLQLPSETDNSLQLPSEVHNSVQLPSKADNSAEETVKTPPWAKIESVQSIAQISLPSSPTEVSEPSLALPHASPCIVLDSTALPKKKVPNPVVSHIIPEPSVESFTLTRLAPKPAKDLDASCSQTSDIPTVSQEDKSISLRLKGGPPRNYKIVSSSMSQVKPSPLVTVGHTTIARTSNLFVSLPKISQIVRKTPPTETTAVSTDSYTPKIYDETPKTAEPITKMPMMVQIPLTAQGSDQAQTASIFGKNKLLKPIGITTGGNGGEAPVLLVSVTEVPHAPAPPARSKSPDTGGQPAHVPWLKFLSGAGPPLPASEYPAGRDPTRMQAVNVPRRAPLLTLAGDVDRIIVTSRRMFCADCTYWTVEGRQLVFSDDKDHASYSLLQAIANKHRRRSPRLPAHPAAAPPDVYLDDKHYRKLKEDPLIYAQVWTVVSDSSGAVLRSLASKAAALGLWSRSRGTISELRANTSDIIEGWWANAQSLAEAEAAAEVVDLDSD